VGDKARALGEPNAAGDAVTGDGAPLGGAGDGGGGGGDLPTIAPAYNKSSSFFDTLSAGQGERPSLAAERSRNADTFGATGLSHDGNRHYYSHYHSGGGRGGGGGGGGRGGGRSGGRGGYGGGQQRGQFGNGRPGT
jgi:hypothetical protein